MIQVALNNGKIYVDPYIPSEILRSPDTQMVHHRIAEGNPSSADAIIWGKSNDNGRWIACKYCGRAYEFRMKDTCSGCGAPLSANVQP